MYGWFKPLRGEAHQYKILGFDVEGSGSGEGFICGAIAGEDGTDFYTDRVQMWGDLLQSGWWGYRLCAHNLEYDLPILEGPEFPGGDLLYTRYGLLWAKYKQGGHKVHFWDTCNLFPRHSLAAVGALVSLDKIEIDPLVLENLGRGVPWRSYLAVQQEQIERYVRRDAEIVYRGVSMLQELALELGGQLRPTISGVAMDIFRRRYHKWPWKVLGPQTNKFVRGAYYGGRVENFAVGQVENVNMYDVTSMYPSAQSQTSFPHPNKLKLEIMPQLSGEWMKWEGIASVGIEVPESFIPALPFRHTKRLFFPYGRLDGEWTILEIRRALQAGAILRRVNWVLGSPTTFNPFTDFVNGLFSLREFYLAEDMGAANLIKLILNSLYGRWGLNPEAGLYQLINIEHETDYSKLEGYTTHDFGGTLFAYGKIENMRHPDYANVFLAAQIAAQGRSILFDELERQGERAVYCDTDSIITYGEISTGPGLGDWRLQMEGGSADLIGPKEYALHNQYLGSVYKAKGIPAKLAEEYLQTGAIRFFRALSVREAFAQGQRPSEWVETVRSSNIIVPKRWIYDPVISGNSDYFVTYPYQRRELAGLIGDYSQPVEIETPYLDRVRPGGVVPLQPDLFV